MATATRKARTPRTKGEVQQEFAEIRKSASAAQDANDPKAAELERDRVEEARRAVEGISVEAVVQRISGLGLEVSRALSLIKEQLTAEVAQLAGLREAAELERKELERLHKIDIAATALDQLIQDYSQQKERLEREISAQRTFWEEEKESIERAQAEQADALKKQRQREADDFEYRKAQERKKAQDKYEEEQRLLEKKNAEKQEALEKQWQVREQALAEREQAALRLRTEVEQFPARLQSEIEKAVAEARQQTERQFEQQLLILKKDREADQRLNEIQVKTLQDTVARQSAHIADLQKQVEEAKKQVQDIAVKAIEGASGAKALSHINQIAMEQAKQRSGQG